MKSAIKMAIQISRAKRAFELANAAGAADS
jgi:hypothetical protein